jgi:hypothetical protein
MADENQEIQEVQEPQLSPLEQRAVDQGWKPQDQWEGNPDDWRPAKEFVDRGELFKKIDELKRDNKALRQGQEELMKHHSRVREAAYAQALSDLKAKKLNALEEGDAKAVVEIDEQIDATKEAQRVSAEQARHTEVAPVADPIFDNWVNRNNWYTQDIAMKAVADEVARMTFAKVGNDKERILDAVDEAVKKAFPHKFENPNRSKAGAVEGSTNKSTVKKESTDADLSDVEKQIMNKILRVTPGMTKEKYLSELKAVKSRGVK